jgi:predicted nucleic acid-binding protein
MVGSAEGDFVIVGRFLLLFGRLLRNIQYGRYRAVRNDPRNGSEARFLQEPGRLGDFVRSPGNPVKTAAGFCQHPGLLITDALSVALMQAHGLTKLASDDTDFDRVPEMTRYAPV